MRDRNSPQVTPQNPRSAIEIFIFRMQILKSSFCAQLRYRCRSIRAPKKRHPTSLGGYSAPSVRVKASDSQGITSLNPYVRVFSEHVRFRAQLRTPKIYPHFEPRERERKKHLSKLIKPFANQHLKTYQIHSFRHIEATPSFQGIALCSGSSNGPFKVLN
jgi:hypothetical protein